MQELWKSVDLRGFYIGAALRPPLRIAGIGWRVVCGLGTFGLRAGFGRVKLLRLPNLRKAK